MNFESAGNPHFFLSFCRVMRGCIRKEVLQKANSGRQTVRKMLCGNKTKPCVFCRCLQNKAKRGYCACRFAILQKSVFFVC